MLLPSFFVQGTTNKEVLPVVESLKTLQYNAASGLIVGPAKSGKTSLLFQYAYHAALYGQTVWFICFEQKIHTQFPLFQAQFEPDPKVLKRIHIKYIEDHTVLRHFVANLPLLEDSLFPNLLVIDNLSEYFPSIRSFHHRDPMVETFALIKEVQMFAEKKHGNSFFSLSSLGMNSQSESFQAIERWIDGIFIIKEQAETFELSLYSINKQKDPTSLKILYSLSSYVDIQSISFDIQ